MSLVNSSFGTGIVSTVLNQAETQSTYHQHTGCVRVSLVNSSFGTAIVSTALNQAETQSTYHKGVTREL